MKKLLLFCLGIIALGACKKDTEPAPLTRTDLLLAKSWRMSAQIATFTSPAINGGAPTVTDVYGNTQYYPACKRDNFISFKADKTVVADEGATKCNPSDPQTLPGSWDLNSDQTKLTLLDPSQSSTPRVLDVLELTATTMRLRYTIVTGTAGISFSTDNDMTFTTL